jgi:hypothetical protein
VARGARGSHPKETRLDLFDSIESRKEGKCTKTCRKPCKNGFGSVTANRAGFKTVSKLVQIVMRRSCFIFCLPQTQHLTLLKQSFAVSFSFRHFDLVVLLLPHPCCLTADLYWSNKSTRRSPHWHQDRRQSLEPS